MSVNRITCSQEIIDALQPVPNFKSKNEIKTWIHDILDGRGINLVIERSDSSKVVFKCKNLHRKQNTPRPLLQDSNLPENKRKRLRSVPEDSCPFRLRVSYSVKNKNWSVNIISDEHNPALCSNFGNHNGGSAFPTPNSSISTPIGANGIAAVVASNSLNKKRCLSSAYNTPIHLQSPRDSPLASQTYGTPEYGNDSTQMVQSSSSGTGAASSAQVAYTANRRVRMSMPDDFEELNAFQIQSNKIANHKVFQRHQLTNLQRSSSPSPTYQLPSQAHHRLPSQQKPSASGTPIETFNISDFQIPEELKFNSNENSLLLNHRTATNLSETFDDLSNIHVTSTDNKLLDSLDFELNQFTAANTNHFSQPLHLQQQQQQQDHQYVGNNKPQLQQFSNKTNNHSPTNSIPISPSTNLPLAPFSLKSQSSSPKDWNDNQVEVLFDQDSILEFFTNPGNYEDNFLMNTEDGMNFGFEENDLLFLQGNVSTPVVHQSKAYQSTNKFSPLQFSSAPTPLNNSSTPQASQNIPTPKQVTGNTPLASSNSTSRYRTIQPAPARKALSTTTYHQPIQPKPSGVNRKATKITPSNSSLMKDIHEDLRDTINASNSTGYSMKDLEELDRAYMIGGVHDGLFDGLLTL